MKTAKCAWISKQQLNDIIHDLNAEQLRADIDCPVHGLVEKCLVTAPKMITTNQINAFRVYCEKCDQQYAVPLFVSLKIEEVAP